MMKSSSALVHQVCTGLWVRLSQKIFSLQYFLVIENALEVILSNVLKVYFCSECDHDKRGSKIVLQKEKYDFNTKIFLILLFK